MLEKLIANLKESIPEPLRKKLGLENSNDDQPAEESEEEIQDSHDTSDNENAPEEDPKKKQISMIIRVAVVLGLAYLAIDQFVLKSNDPSTEIANIPTKPRKPRRIPVNPPVAEPAVTAADATATAETSAIPVTAETTTAAAEMTETSAVVPAETVPAVEITPASEVVAQNEAPPAAEVTPATEVVPPIENINIAEKVDEPAVGEVKPAESQVEKSLDSLIDSVDGNVKQEEDSTSKKETRLEDKIVADDVYTPPPAYDQLGRGLVYNCKEKYWACIDKVAYVTCNKNMKWNQSNGKPAECAIQNVYNSDDDCNVVQKYNVSTSKPTPFCQ